MSDDERYRGTAALLADLQRKPRDSLRDQLIANATANLYHDYKSPLETPKIRLINDLTKYGYRDLARKAKAGVYSDPPDAVAHEAELAADPKLAAAWAEAAKTSDPGEALRILGDHFGLSQEERVIAAAEVFPAETEQAFNLVRDARKKGPQ